MSEDFEAFQSFLDDPTNLYESIQHLDTQQIKIHDEERNGIRYIMLRALPKFWPEQLHVYSQDRNGTWRKACTYTIKDSAYAFEWNHIMGDIIELIDEYFEKTMPFK